MDIVLGVSMAPTTVRLVLVEGDNADGVTVDEGGFELGCAHSSGSLSAAADQTVAAILGTEEGAADGDYRLASIGVTWTDPVEAAALRDALAAHKVENVMLVSSFMAAAALAQSVGSAAGYARTGLLFLEPDTVTLAVVDSADGSIIAVQRQSMRNADTPVEMLAALTGLDSAPDGVFVVGTGVDIATVKPQLEAATALPVTASEEPELALARGAALASANVPSFLPTTTALAYARDPEPDWTTAEVVDPYRVTAEASDVDADDAFTAAAVESLSDRAEPGRKPFLVVLGVMLVFFVGVLALVASLAVGAHPAVSQRPSSSGNLIAPAKQLPVPHAAVSPPAAPQPASAPQPEQAGPAPAPEAPAPEAPAPASVHVAPVPAAAPAAAPALKAPAPAVEPPAAQPPAPAAVPPAPAVVPSAPVVVPSAPVVVPWAPAVVPQAPAVVPRVPAALAPATMPAHVPVPIIAPVAPSYPQSPAPIFAPPAQRSPLQPGGGFGTKPGTTAVTGSGGGGFGGSPGGYGRGGFGGWGGR